MKQSHRCHCEESRYHVSQRDDVAIPLLVVKFFGLLRSSSLIHECGAICNDFICNYEHNFVKTSLIVFLFLSFLFAPNPLQSQTPFNQENATRILEHISVDIGARTMGSPAEQQGLQYAIDKFKEYGCDTAYLMPMTRSSHANTNSGIAIGIKRGATDRIIVLGGHMDSVEPEIPGANDDGSGSAVTIEACRVLCAEPHQSTLVFCCFSGEEQGLEGSTYFVDHFYDIKKVDLMLQTDMANGLGNIDLLIESQGEYSPRWLVKAAVEEFYKSGYKNLRYATIFLSMNNVFGGGVGSDHEPFLFKGIPAIDFTTEPGDPIHTPRDNFDNFEPRGLKRCGDVIVKLANRFDSGVPSRQTESYFLILAGQTPIFISLKALPIALAIAFLISTLIFVFLRKRRDRNSNTGPWTVPIMVLFSIVIVSFGWFSTNIVGLMKGMRHPWLAYPETFYLLALVGVITGFIICARMTQKFRITTCPYRLFRASYIMLFIFMMVSLLFGNVSIALAPAFGLACISLAMFAKNTGLKLFFLALSPLWMMRLIFSEWKELIFRSLALMMPADMSTTIAFNGIIVFFFSLYILPYLFGFAAVLRTLPSQRRLYIFKSEWASAIAIIVYITSAIVLTNIPSYNRLWFRNVNANLSMNMNTKASTFTLTSSEYLRSIRITTDGIEKRLRGRSIKEELPLPASFDTSMVTVQHIENQTTHGDTTDIDLELRLLSRKRPYTVSVGYPKTTQNRFPISSSPLLISSKDGQQVINFYSFPDTALNIPVKLQVVGKDTITETIRVVFSELPPSMKIEGDLCYVIPRMEYLYSKKYFR